MKKIYTILLSLILVLSLVACTGNSSTKTAETNNDEKVKSTENIKDEIITTVILKEGENEISKNDFQVKSGDNLLKVLKDNFEIEEDNGFITSIEGKSQNEKEGIYWLYTINGESAEIGAGDYEIKDKDVIVFTLSKI